MTQTLLDVRNLYVQFPTEDGSLVKAVDGISFQVKRGQTIGIVGESGSGKSVTSLAVMGLVPTPGKTQGEIWFQGISDNSQNSEAIDLLSLSPEKMQQYRGGQISMIFQEPMSSLNPVFTIGYQLIEAIKQHQDVSETEARRQAIARLQEVRILASDEQLKQRYFEEKTIAINKSEVEINQYINNQKLAILNRYPHELSGGQIQRVMIAMAISCNPSLLIADEPTTALDVTVQAAILDLLRELRDHRQMSMIFITHDLGLIAEIADSVAVMYQGKIVEYGSILDVFSNPQHPYTKGLLACRPRPDKRLQYLPTVSDFMEVISSADGEINIREKLANQEKIGAEISATDMAFRLAELRQKPPLLSVQNFLVAFPVRGIFGETKRYFNAVNNVSFDVYPGETLGLVGESGCGKTTLARALLQLIPASGGRVIFAGEEVTLPWGENRGLLQDKIAAWYPKNIIKKYRNYQEYLQKLRWLRRDMQIIFQNPFGSLNPRMKIGDAVMEPLLINKSGNNYQVRRDRAAYLLERVGLNPDSMHRYPHEFSGGQRQRICIARALALNPKFIICDESVSALDVSVQAQVLNLLKELQAEFGLTYIFISHDLGVVKFMSDRIVVMNRGKIEEIGPAEMIYRQPQQEYTRQLIAAIPVGTIERIQECQKARIANDN